MAEISILSKEVSELIAAGEVIERPASVIKELMENSIDAGAKKITVEIKNGGRTYMRVTDSGKGIQPDDVLTAFIRHATSKIHDRFDLDNISTLGFRGEALASISAVSRVEIITKTVDYDFGMHYVFEAGDVKKCEDVGCPDGTTISVRDIFFNVPARLKFLKKDVSEGNAIANVVSKIALSHPEISFKFIRDNRSELVTPGDGKLRSAIYAVMGKTFTASLIPVDYSLSGVSIKGYVTKPLMSKANRSFQNFYVNSRYVKSVTCMVALEEAYRNSIMTGKFPGCVLNLEIDPACLDVNVHPAKLEIRFSDEKPVYDAVYFAVKNALMLGDKTMEAHAAEIAPPAQKQLTVSEIFNRAEREKAYQLTFDSTPAELTPNQVFKKALDAAFTVSKPSEDDPEEERNPYLGRFVFKRNTPESADSPEKPQENENNTTEPAPPEQPAPEAEVQPEPIPEFRIVGELFRTYIVVEMNDDMYLVDKHAAHERYNFDRLKSGVFKADIQALAIPFDIELSYDEYTAVIENRELFNRFGFEIQPLDPPKVKLYGVPLLLTDDEPTDLLVNFADRISKGSTDGGEIFDELFHSVACKASIRANSFSRPEELEKLVGLILANRLMYCPHGRPTMIKFTRREIEKLFKRIV